MSLWLALGAMTAVAVALLLVPLLRGRGPVAARREFDLEVYRAQLQELAREQERGLIGPSEAAGARLEIERRMLATDADPAKAQTLHPLTARRALTALALLIGLPLISGALYWQLGRPELPGQPFAERAEERQLAASGQRSPGAPLPPVETMVARLQERVARAPEDLEGWVRLGQAYTLTGRFEAAADAYRRAIALRGDLAALHAGLGEALVMAQDGVVSEPARAAFARALALDPADPRARFYRGLALVQRGEQEQALEVWRALLADAPAAAPWRADLRTRLVGLAQELGRDPAEVLPAEPAPPTVAEDAADGTARGPSREQMRAAEAMTPEARAEMIRGMVEGLAARLEAAPDDVEGWRMLGRSYRVLEEPDKAAEAYQRVASLLPDDVDAQLDYADALLAAQGPGEGLSAPLVSQMRRVLELDADNPQALFVLGRAAADAGDAAAAARYWQQLLAQLPAGSTERTEVQRLIEQLAEGQ